VYNPAVALSMEKGFFFKKKEFLPNQPLLQFETSHFLPRIFFSIFNPSTYPPARLAQYPPPVKNFFYHLVDGHFFVFLHFHIHAKITFGWWELAAFIIDLQCLWFVL
jgi:hypothetical protein